MPSGIYKRKATKKTTSKKAKKKAFVKGKEKRKYNRKNALEVSSLDINVKLDDIDTSNATEDFAMTKVVNAPYDGTAYIKRSSSKNSSSALKITLTPFVLKTGFKPKQICLGIDTKSGRVYAIFDNADKKEDSCPVSYSGNTCIASGWIVKKFFRLLGVPIPDIGSEPVKLLFSIKPIDSDKAKPSYRICEVKLMKESQKFAKKK